MKTIQLAVLALSFSSVACGQNLSVDNLPSLVQNGLKTQFPAAEKVEWEKKGANFEAEFDLAQVEHTALVDATGTILMHKVDVDSTQVPAGVLQAIQKNYAAYKLDDVEKVMHQGQEVYQVELEKTFSEKKVVYRADGSVSDKAYWE